MADQGKKAGTEEGTRGQPRMAQLDEDQQETDTEGHRAVFRGEDDLPEGRVVARKGEEDTEGHVRPFGRPGRDDEPSDEDTEGHVRPGRP